MRQLNATDYAKYARFNSTDNPFPNVATYVTTGDQNVWKNAGIEMQGNCQNFQSPYYDLLRLIMCEMFKPVNAQWPTIMMPTLGDPPTINDKVCLFTGNPYPANTGTGMLTGSVYAANNTGLLRMIATNSVAVANYPKWAEDCLRHELYHWYSQYTGVQNQLSGSGNEWMSSISGMQTVVNENDGEIYVKPDGTYGFRYRHWNDASKIDISGTEEAIQLMGQWGVQLTNDIFSAWINGNILSLYKSKLPAHFIK